MKRIGRACLNPYLNWCGMIETGYAYRVWDKYLKKQMKTYKKCMKQTHKNEIITVRERKETNM
jgi:hypothetical protein